MPDAWRPIDLGRAAGISAQTVRTYEAVGFLPPAGRTPTGYRRYGPRHLQALLAARAMIAGYGWQEALGIMRLVHQGDLAAAVAAVDACHAALHQQRCDGQATLQALRRSATLEPVGGGLARGRRTRTHLQVGQAARRVGVRVSTVRFWEEQGLLAPQREPRSGYRLYDAAQMHRLEVIALLRRGGYGVEAIRPILEELAGGHLERAVAAAEGRLAELTKASQRATAATAAFWDYTRRS